MPLSAAELAGFRATQDENLPDTCTISRATLVADGMGGFTETWATVATVACRLGVAGTRPNEVESSEQLRNVADFVFTFPRGTSVLNGDRIVMGIRTFDVVKAQDHSWQTAMRAQVVEVT